MTEYLAGVKNVAWDIWAEEDQVKQYLTVWTIWTGIIWQQKLTEKGGVAKHFTSGLLLIS